MERWPAYPEGVAENRFRELIRIRLMREKVLSKDAESDLLKDAVTKLGLSLDKARGLLVSETDNSSIDLESDIDDATSGILASLANDKKKISYRDFEIASRFHARKTRKNMEDARREVKRIMEVNLYEPKAAGILRTRRWYRRIKV